MSGEFDGLQRFPYSDDPTLEISQARYLEMAGTGDLERLAAFDFTFEDLTMERLVLSMANQVAGNFAMFWTVLDDVVGEETGLKVAHSMGLTYGGLGYGRFLAARGAPNHGSPRLMAEYQDIAHATRGPKHATALYAEFNDECVVIQRDNCVYYSEPHAKYVQAFETGGGQAYVNVDENLLEVDYVRCRWKGCGDCKHVFRFKAAQER